MNIENLQKLSKYLRTVDPAKFNMNKFATAPVSLLSAIGLRKSVIDTMTDCGTAGCAVGHAPDAGIPKYSTESWVAYSCRVFDIAKYDTEWIWMFDEIWTCVDNTPHGAADRIDYLLGHPEFVGSDDWRRISIMALWQASDEVAEELRQFLIDQGMESFITEEEEGQYERHF